MRSLRVLIIATVAMCVAPAAASAATASAVSAGDGHACAITSGGLKCWGDNGFGQLGLADGAVHYRPATVTLPGAAAATRVSAGGKFTCAASSTKIWCWGESYSGQIGVGDDRPASAAPQQVVGITGAVTALATGSSHACAATRSSSSANDVIRCWGNNSYGQLGDGTTTNSNRPVAVKAVTGVKITQLTAGDGSSCALLASGTVKCWGVNSSFAKGLTALKSVKAIAQGGSHLCAVLSSGTVKCLGSGSAGQLGDGKAKTSYTPVTATGLTKITAIGAGSYHSCAVKSTKSIVCWGLNNYRQTESAKSGWKSSPVANGVSSAKSFDGGQYFGCAVQTTGAVKCWGDNVSYQLGDPEPTGWLATAVI